MNTPRTPDQQRETTGLTRLLAQVVEDRPDAVAVIDDTPQGRETTYGALWRQAVALADDLREHGVSAGDCVGVYLPNWVDSIVWQFAAAGVGAHVIGINTRYAVADVEHVLAKANPRVVAVAHDFRGLPLGERLRQAVSGADAPAPGVAVITGPDRPEASPDIVSGYDVGAGAWAPTVGTDTDSGPLDTTALPGVSDTLAVAFTTSGSTGKPKLAAHLDSNVAHHARHTARSADMGPDSTVLISLPLSGVLAFVPAYACLAAGGALILQPSFDGPAALDLMARHGVTHLSAADDISGRVRAAWLEHPADLSGFQRLLIGDFYGRSREIAEWTEAHTGATTVGIYGSSEVFAWLTFWRASDPAPDRWRGGGRATAPGTELRVIDPLTGTPLPTGEAGELQVRGYAVVDAYLGDHDGSVMASNLTEDGWFRTGDLCVMEDEQTFVYQCRIGDSLRLKGFLVEPVEIESVIAQLPEVERVKVVGVPGQDETQAIGFVTLRAGQSLDADRILAHCSARLARYKVPHAVHVIEEMPTTLGTNGTKIRAAALREMAQNLHPQQPEASAGVAPGEEN